uniref:Uncharacterized protein n=1 Tax=Glossina brevipalpis TaxID=37001 RepID=A0A1A9W706_9MUSC
MDVSKDYHKTPEKFGKLLNEVPSRKFKEKMDSNTQALGEMQQTPRRSCRKSIKPLQDYVQIVSQTMRSTKKSIFSEEDSQDKDYELADQEKPKRTPAKAGRRSRKTRRDSKTKVSELHESKDKEHNTTEDEQIKLNHTRKENNLEKILEDVELEGREDENKENIQVIGKKRENEDELKEYSNENNNEGDKQFQVAKAELQKSLTIETQNGCTSSEKKDTRLSIQKGRINDSVHTEEQEEYMSIKKDIINQEEEKHLFTKENSNNEIGHIEEQNEAKSNEEQGDVEMHGINEIIIEQEQYSIKGRVQKENCRQTFPEGANKDITFQENCNQTYTEDASKDAAAIVKTAEVIEINTISMQMDQEMVAEEETTHADVLVDVIKENEIHDELLKPENENISKSHDGISFAKENSNNEIGHIEEQNEAKSNEEQGDFEMHAINEVIIEQEQYSIKGRLQTENCYQTYTEDASKDAAAIVKTAEVIEINTINMQMSQHVVAEEADVLVDVVKENEIHDELLKPENENISKSHDGISLQIPTEKQEGFGSYLKTKDFDMEDLGLNPLEDDTAQLPQKPYQSLNPAEVNNKPKYEQGNEEFGTEAVLDKVFGEDDEMPSLIYCDDDEDGDYDDYDIEFKKIDSTVIIIEDEIVEDIKSTTFTRDDEVQTFELSDDESEDLTKTPVKSKPVMIRPTCSEKQTQTPSTTRKVRKICRFPTPHSNKLNLFANNMKNYEQRPDQEDSLDKFIDSPVTITTSEPKEALLRGIRKRSLSLCIDGMENDYNPPPKDNLVRPPKIVSFRTPTLGNPQKKKEIMKSDVEAFKTFKNEHVTKRRKRSMSLDEIMNRIPKLRGTGEDSHFHI